MKNNLIILFLVLIVFGLSSCGTEFELKEHNDFYIEVPKSMQDNQGMIFEGAEMELEDTLQDCYIVVLKDDKLASLADDIETYQIENIEFILKDGSTKFETEKTKIHDRNAIITDAITIEEQDTTFWKVSVVEQEENYFSVWTWWGNRFHKQNIKNMTKTVKSIKIK